MLEESQFESDRPGGWLWLALVVVLLSPVACKTLAPRANGDLGRSFSEAEGLFHQNPLWLGADAALSIPLDSDRTLWLFGDTFVATSEAHSRSQSEMVRNTIAIQVGHDPRTSLMEFHWRQDPDGSPASFFPEKEPYWYWPGHGIRLAEGPLVIFLYKLVGTPGQGLGFASAGYALTVIDDPDEPVEKWEPRVVDAALSPFDAVPATAVIRDGPYVVALAIRQEGTHAGALVRWLAASLAQGDVGGAEWWDGPGRGWVPEPALGPGGPEFVLDDAGAECSIHWDAGTRSFIHVASYGFGASTIGLRTAPSVTGPWSSPIQVYRPPESDGSRPFVYAAKAHHELIGPDPADLVITYATNSFDFADLFTKKGQRSLYWPRFVVVQIGQ
ncbi:MAG: hypothetical protein O6947_05985 [Acidobacteria bacterium]|nr:hypothetical protein [Acidobacteriota bacterium]